MTSSSDDTPETDAAKWKRLSVESLDAWVDSVAGHEDWSSDLKLDREFIPSISQEASDWGFTLKSAAVAEALLNELILLMLAPNDKIDYCNSETGYKLPSGLRCAFNSKISDKIKLGEELKYLAEGWAAYYRALFRVRNQYAHNIRYINYTLLEMIEKRFDKDLGSDIYDALAFPIHNDDGRATIIETMGLDAEPIVLNTLSVKKPLRKMSNRSMRETIKHNKQFGADVHKVGFELRSAMLMTLLQIASIVQSVKNAPVD